MHRRAEPDTAASDTRPSDRAGPLSDAVGSHAPPAGPRSTLAGPSQARTLPRSVALLSVHTSPLAQPGTGDGGGMNVFVAALARQLRARDIGVQVFTRSTGSDLPPTVTLDDGVQVHHIEAGPPTLRKADLASHLCAFYLAVAAHPAIPTVDLLHGHYWMSGWVGRKLRARRQLPLVQRFHTLAHTKDAGRAAGEAAEPMLRHAAERRVVAAADAVLAATSDEARVLRREYRATPAQVHVIPPGVDTSTFTPDGDRVATRRELGGGRLLLFVGRLQPLKGPDTAIRALAALDRHLPDDGIPTRLLIVGGASGNGHGTVDPPALRRLADELGVDDRVALLTPRPHPQLAALYRAADVVLMPSRSESFGLVALEALACGTPVVASDTGGLRDLVSGGAGAVVEGHAPDAYARAVLPFLVGAERRRDASRAALASAQRFSWSTTTDRTLDVYRSVLQAATPLRGRRGA